MSETTDAVTVEQIDRDAAADLCRSEQPWIDEMWVRHIRKGGADDTPRVKAFARHRLAALASPVREDGEACSLEECPPGLFTYKARLGFKSEYYTRPRQPDAYCVDSGEYFWGGTAKLNERLALKVVPVVSISTPYRDEALRVARFKLGDRVRKIKGSSWQGRVVGTYSTALTPEGYAVESERELGSVQIYPAAALVEVSDV